MIGILAGMGPKSTGPFIDKIVEQCQIIYGATYDMDYPKMMIYSCPTPFYLDRPIDHMEMEHAIISGTKKLASTGVDFIAIPCNTAHTYFDKIEGAVSIPILNMVKETIAQVSTNCKKVTILATPATIDSGIYQKGIKESGLHLILKNDWQENINTIIKLVKSSSKKTEGIDLWNKLMKEIEKEVDTAIIACTDLNIISDKTISPIQIIDSSTSLARAVVKTYLEWNRE